ncbi:hypothetical protein [Mesorhizobium sp. ES1-1]|uniref:hypothetical protein n=1 Tax=Mesorhizobium sp. ES1-1 TaxID=2876629 RepID=UPI001CC97939|nr:hypothetical protein [Mesorhizobium sp. ES1-1]MBZ9678929.1 hypothetical protein [Mesorhizobium sp. ES1-1]
MERLKTAWFMSLALFLGPQIALAEDPNPLDDPPKMERFFTDADLKRMKADEVKSAWKEMSADERRQLGAIAKDMERGVRQPNKELVETVKELQGPAPAVPQLDSKDDRKP